MSEYYTLHHDDAWKIAEAAVKEIKKINKGGVVTIVSSHGRRILQYAMEGITPYNTHLSEQKAKQASSVGRRTRFIRDHVNIPDHPYSPKFLNIPEDEYVPWAGGDPIMDEDLHVLGGIGICIASEDEDEKIAVRAVEDCGYISDRT